MDEETKKRYDQCLVDIRKEHPAVAFILDVTSEEESWLRNTEEKPAEEEEKA